MYRFKELVSYITSEEDITKDQIIKILNNYILYLDQINIAIPKATEEFKMIYKNLSLRGYSSESPLVAKSFKSGAEWLIDKL